MIVATVDYPDERTGANHLHGYFDTKEMALHWVGWISTQIDRSDLVGTYIEVAGEWTCPKCRWATRFAYHPDRQRV